MYAIGKLLINVVVVLFFVGMAGSAVVVAISFFDDLKELFAPDESSAEEPRHAPPASSAGTELRTFAPKQRAS